MSSPEPADAPTAPLRAKQARFVEEYLVDLNATQAAIRAGYSPKGAAVRGAELVINRKVAAAIASAQAARSVRTQITQDCVIRGLRLIAENDDAQDGARVRAWELLGRHLGLFPASNQAPITIDARSVHFNVSPEEAQDAARRILGR